MTVKNPSLVLPTTPPEALEISNGKQENDLALNQTLMQGGLFKQVYGASSELVFSGIPMDVWYHSSGLYETENETKVIALDENHFAYTDCSIYSTTFTSSWLNLYDKKTGICIQHALPTVNNTSYVAIDAVAISADKVLVVRLTQDGRIFSTVVSCLFGHSEMADNGITVDDPRSVITPSLSATTALIEVSLSPQGSNGHRPFSMVVASMSNSQIAVVQRTIDVTKGSIDGDEGVVKSLGTVSLSNLTGVTRRHSEVVRSATLYNGSTVVGYIPADSSNSLALGYCPIDGESTTKVLTETQGTTAFDILPISTEQNLFAVLASSGTEFKAMAYDTNLTSIVTTTVDSNPCKRLSSALFKNGRDIIALYTYEHNSFSIEQVNAVNLSFLVGESTSISVGTKQQLQHGGVYPTSWFTDVAVFQAWALGDGTWGFVGTPHLTSSASASDNTDVYQIQYNLNPREGYGSIYTGTYTKSDVTPVRYALRWLVEHAEPMYSLSANERTGNKGALALWGYIRKPMLSSEGAKDTLGVGITTETISPTLQGECITPIAYGKLDHVPMTNAEQIKFSISVNINRQRYLFVNIQGWNEDKVLEASQRCVENVKNHMMSQTYSSSVYTDVGWKMTVATYTPNSNDDNGNYSMYAYLTKNLLKYTDDPDFHSQRIFVVVPLQVKEGRNITTYNLDDLSAVYIDLAQEDTNNQYYNNLTQIPIRTAGNSGAITEPD